VKPELPALCRILTSAWSEWPARPVTVTAHSLLICIKEEAQTGFEMDSYPRPLRNWICLWPDKSVTVCQWRTKSDVLWTLDEECDPDLAEISEFKGKICFKLTPKMPVRTLRSKENQSFIKVREESIGSDFRSCFLSEDFSDISVRFSGASIPCHKLVLSARCEYFKRVLKSNGKKDVEHEIFVDAADATQDCTNDDFKATIFYLYSGTLPDEVQGLNFDPCLTISRSRAC
jgi:hypothetical protein